MTVATSDKTNYYTEDGASISFNNTIRDTNNCCEIGNESNCCNNSRFNAHQSSDVTYHVHVDDAPLKGYNHEYDCPSNTHHHVNN